MTKKELKKWLQDIGLSCSYSGNHKIMFIHGITPAILEGYNLETNGFTLKSD